MTRRFSTSRSRRVAFGLLCLALLAGAIALPATANKTKVLGKTRHTPNPSCPKDTRKHPCQAIGSVTGFQIKADGERGVFKAPHDGRLLAWAVDLSRPNKEQRKFFGGLFKTRRFGSDPTARIGVLSKRHHQKYKLLRESPVVDFKNSFGDKQIITLNKPLRIRKGQILALTTPTWLPNFATKLSARGNQWRASRPSGKCGGNQALKAKPHQKVGTVREYGCRFSTARLLYWGYYVRT